MNPKLINQKIFSKNILNSLDFAYWLGVVQSDGFIKKLKKGTYYIGLSVSDKSLPMFNRFVEISQNLFKNKGSIYSLTREELKSTQFLIGCTYFAPFFKKLNINFKEPIPLDFIIKNNKLFGSYLAAIIDGDADVRITRPQYPQCYIRIHVGKKPIFLIELIKKKLNCGVNYAEIYHEGKIKNRIIAGTSRRIEFRTSPKNFNFFIKYILPHIRLDYKKEKIKKYIEMRGWYARIEYAK